MQGVSDKALKTNYAENKYRYNAGTELQNEEFSDGSGLETYETTFRSFDPQLGRFAQVDPMADEFHFFSTYQYAINNPISGNDPTGLKTDDPHRSNYSVGYQAYINDLANPMGHDPMEDALQFMMGGMGSGGSSADVKNSADLAITYANTYFNNHDAFGNNENNIDFSNPIIKLANALNRLNSEGYDVTRISFGIDKATGDYSATINFVGGESKPGVFVGASIVDLAELNDYGDKLNTILGGAGISLDLTRNGLIGAQLLANKFGGTSYVIQDIGKLKLLKLGDLGSLTVEGLGNIAAGVSLFFTFRNIVNRGLNWDNGTDAVMGLVAFVPGVGWIISGSYFFANSIIKVLTGYSIGDLMQMTIGRNPGVYIPYFPYKLTP